jgi:hypothetical protein
MLDSGVPQGVVLSQLYVSDLEEWLTDSTAITYADDTTTSTLDNDLDKLKLKMEQDAEAVP